MLPEFPITGLNNEQVKHTIVEIYDATKNEVIKHLASEIKNAPIPPTSLNVDLWTSEISSEKYLGLWLFNRYPCYYIKPIFFSGVRIWCISPTFALHTDPSALLETYYETVTKDLVCQLW